MGFFYSLFLPHPSNNHRAKILHHRSLLFLIALIAFSSFFFSSKLNPFSNKILTFADISVKELLNDTNQKRAQNGLPTLSENQQLDLAAQNKAADMIAKNYWAHNSPAGTTPWDFIKGSGYEYVYAGENLARGFSSASDVVSAWMASPDHRANLLSPNYNDVGFSVVHGNLEGEETFLVVQEFGSKNIVPGAYKTITPPKITNVLGFNISPKLENIKNLSFSSEVMIILIGVLLATLFFDSVIIKKRKIPRVAGHNLDHFFFLISLILIVTIFGVGQII